MEQVTVNGQHVRVHFTGIAAHVEVNGVEVYSAVSEKKAQKVYAGIVAGLSVGGKSLRPLTSLQRYAADFDGYVFQAATGPLLQVSDLYTVDEIAAANREVNKL